MDRKNFSGNPPIFMQDPKTNEILKQVIQAAPKHTKIYVVGGVVRNALYYHFFHKKLPQRDYDILFIGNKKKFIEKLRLVGFTYGLLKRKDEITLKRKKVNNPRQLSDYIYLDIHISNEKSVTKNLIAHSNFTINGFALPLKYVASKNWHRKIIALPNAIHDLKEKSLRVNKITHPADLFACLRFMSQGFKAPSKQEVTKLLSALRKLEKWRYQRNVKKVFDYVGGEKKARNLAAKLGITENIFDFATIKNYPHEITRKRKRLVHTDFYARPFAAP
ncbi:hypothetical protein A2757_01150 [Candidatus Giovannonibacteria bacterium RIFCSPHIGHO2_01_FULL_48_47]|nr:MAG: hypothetical protein A2757_01150 [Candidatus Giovannonibacteria bacterium RIFCSPHIGHO2_01_FULL_48_47]OGF67735.1 MAG: hypothetical protein A3D61_03745 [Candidatus Giovannonibacteria bacterium RIFCSPHIGHO2_02_FULL_48_15]OGF88043.1 MAG: hypothetical protein A3B26_00995 [Candidatus Giovannonibacteria bacterium RIFCSPLOWO2_01_FULL_48_47]OGF94836.1 MAG: hypothetical protein A2433_02380 [Candidatus Giovannonibacteria bacterium RIFOXYC1_FULL_48_8]OGF95884.1 MAG: hypothetical protein A2613_03645